MRRRTFGLTARLIIPLAAGLLLLQVGVFAWTFQVHLQEQFRLVVSDRARLAITQYQILATMPPEERAAILGRLNFQTFSLRLSATQPFEQNNSKESKAFLRRLRELYARVYPSPAMECPIVTDMREFSTKWKVTALPDLLDPYIFSRFEAEAALTFPDGTWLVVDYSTVPILFGNQFGLFLELGVQFLLQMLLAVAIIRWLTRPLRQLAAFAESLPSDLSGEEPQGLPAHGPSEVVRTSRALRDMYTRIRHFVEERMRLLASISHDLRTPITRLRLQLENEPALTRPELVFDALDDLQHLAEDAIALARTGKNSEPERRVDLATLLESMVADYEEYTENTECLENEGCPVRLHIEAEPRCLLRPAAFRRCLENLVDNGLRYGGRVDIRLDAVSGETDRKNTLKKKPDAAGSAHFFARVRIDDQGPGIPEDKMAEVFQSFYRLEESRNTRTGGTGLGLSIARDLARLNHTDIILSNLDGSGLRATLLVPMLDTENAH